LQFKLLNRLNKILSINRSLHGEDCGGGLQGQQFDQDLKEQVCLVKEVQPLLETIFESKAISSVQPSSTFQPHSLEVLGVHS
jgi:hypothetical protein